MSTQYPIYVNFPPPLAPRRRINLQEKYEKEFSNILPFICDKNNKSKMCDFIYKNQDIYESAEIRPEEDLNLRDQTQIDPNNYNTALRYYIQERSGQTGKNIKKASICKSFENMQNYDENNFFTHQGGKNTKNDKSKRSRSKKSKRSRTKKNKRSVRK